MPGTENGKRRIAQIQNAHTETRQSNARRVLLSIYHATASYRIGQQGSKIYNTDLSAAKTLLKGALINTHICKIMLVSPCFYTAWTCRSL